MATSLPASSRSLLDWEAEPDASEPVRLSLHLQRRRSWTAAQLHAHGALAPGLRPTFPGLDPAPPEALAALRDFAKAHGLEVALEDAVGHRVDLVGPASILGATFGLIWGRTKAGHRVASGEPKLPEALAPRVASVQGLDGRPRFRPHVHRHSGHGEGRALTGFEVPAFAKRYAFPAGAGQGQRVGLIELGGGYRQADLETFFASLGRPVPRIRVVSVDGATNNPEGSSVDENLEVTLDVEVLGALVPEAELAIYFAPNTDQGFMNAIKAALHDPAGAPSVLSISWGSPEGMWNPLDGLLLSDTCMEAGGLGISLVVSSGDHGSREEGPDHPAVVNFPASSPWVLACGGTTVVGEEERVWNSAPAPGATGGGVSDCFDLPDYQKAHAPPVSVNDGGTRRVVPDVAAVADGATGYRVFAAGKWQVLGGTSAAAPLWAALLARCNAALGKPCGFLHPFLYGDGKARAALRSIDQGSNGDYHARPGFDACTGLGTPHGEKLLDALKGDA